MAELPTLLRSRDNIPIVKHLPRTLKGNFSVFGLTDLARLVHALEQRIDGELGRDATTLRNTVLSWLSDVQMRTATEYFSAVHILVKGLNERFQTGVHYEFQRGQVLVVPQRFLKLAKVQPHLVRNSFDHGIESPEARAKAGKK
jgi:chemotaxis protein histidine kinase CheA